MRYKEKVKYIISQVIKTLKHRLENYYENNKEKRKNNNHL
nr:MAG TPA: hypothetical protein [Caudoviricetes sp.]